MMTSKTPNDRTSNQFARSNEAAQADSVNPTATAGQTADQTKRTSRSSSIKDKSQTISINRQLEHGGREGPDPVRYGDWEKNGRCIDF